MRPTLGAWLSQGDELRFTKQTGRKHDADGRIAADLEQAKIAAEAEKKKGLFAEINNGRLAMIGLFSVLAESAVPGSNPQYAIFDIKIPESSVDIMGSVFPQLTNEFAVKAWPVLAICGFLQQYNKRKTV